MRTQINDKEGLGGKIDSDDKDTVKSALKDAESWLEENSEAESSDIEEKLEELQSLISPITAKLYSEGSDSSESYSHHDEL